MTRIASTFESIKAQNRAALVTFIMANDPDYDTALAAMTALPGAGADIIELGMPFTDPAADGTVIQNAGLRALSAGGCMKSTFQMVRDFRETNTDTPIVLMGYTNPVLTYGFEAFINDASDAGIDGLIIVDLPPEESAELNALASAKGIDLIRLLTPTTDEKRLGKLLKGAGGFLYYVSITGVTGSAKADLSAIEPHIKMIKSHTDLPVAIGFGIKTPADVKTFAALADGVVVGSSLVQSLNDNGVEDAAKLVTSLADAL
jgi:tryptophan synthase alpha chain